MQSSCFDGTACKYKIADLLTWGNQYNNPFRWSEKISNTRCRVKALRFGMKMQGKACAGKFLGGATLTCDCFCLVCHRWFWLRRWWWWCIKNSRAKAAFDGRGKKIKSRVSKLNLDLIDFEGTYVYFLILKQAINKNIYIYITSGWRICGYVVWVCCWFSPLHWDVICWVLWFSLF